MSVSLHITAFTPDTDPEFQKHKKVLMVCKETGVSLPPETAEYFDSTTPYDALLDERLEVELEKDKHYRDYWSDTEDGYELDLNDLPDGVSKLRITLG